MSTSKTAVIGLGSMGLGIATSLLGAGWHLNGCDLSDAAKTKLRDAGGTPCATPAQTVKDCAIVLCVVVNAAQTEAILFAENGAADAMQPGTVFISCATMSPADSRRLAAQLTARDILYLDAPISGGAKKAATGNLSVMASGTPAAFKAADPVLRVIAEKIHQLGDAPGIGASVKMINQLLAGVHIAAACEAMTLAAKLGLDLPAVYAVIKGSAGNSWMFENRVPHILDGDYTPLSAVEIFVKDLGIIQDMARAEHFPVPVASAAMQMFLATAGAGMAGDDDASVARLYAQISGTQLPEPAKTGSRGS